jgi:predicted lipid-binding transport protein (Tim44 family)
MKFKIPKTDKLLNDKNVLYVVFVLAILNLLGYLVVQNTEAVAFFLIVGFLTTYFSKNMIIVLIVAMVTTSLFTATKTSYRSVKEGMTDSSSQQAKDTVKSNMDQKKQAVKEKKQAAQTTQSDNDSSEEEVEELTVVSKGKDRVDLASTLSEAYNNLQKTVGEGGVKELTTQTESLLNQQKQLMDNITTMQPFLETAQSFMDKLDLSSLDGIGDLLSNFGKK